MSFLRPKSPMKFFLLLLSCCLVFSSGRQVEASEPENSRNLCPLDVNTLSNRLINDIPGYGNRVIQTTQSRHQDAGIYNYIILAGSSETQPLNLPQIDYGSQDPDSSNSIEQIFFTTKERQYSKQQKIERQTYHWLFVTLAESGWHLVAMFSRIGNETQNTPPAPPHESSKGIIGQAVSLWLRDCRAGTLR